jgi:hypothetical protein
VTVTEKFATRFKTGKEMRERLNQKAGTRAGRNAG